MNAKRRFLRISLRELLFLVLLLAIVLSFLAAHLRRVYQQRAIVARIREVGGEVEYDFEARQYDAYNIQERIHPSYYRQWFGDDFVSDVYIVHAGIIDDGGAAMLAQLVELREIGFYRSRITDAGLAEIRNLKHLDSLSLNGTAISNQGLASLRNLHELRSLDLSETGITDEGLVAIRHLKQLEKLNLRYTSIGDDGISMLSEMTQLQTLDLRFTEITDAGLESLTKLKTLRSINLEGTYVSAAGFNRINESLPLYLRKTGFAAVPSAEHRLAWREIEQAGGQVSTHPQSGESPGTWHVSVGRTGKIDPRILAALWKLENFDHLDLYGSDLDDLARNHISSLHLRGISLRSMQLGEADFKLLSRMTNLETLVIRGCKCDDSDLGFLTEFKKLKNLVLGETFSISHDTAKQISAISTLESLGLEGIEIDSDAIRQLSNCKNLQSLWLDGSPIDDAGLGSLRGLSSLRQLSVRNTKVTSDGVIELRKSLPQLKVLTKPGESW